ncbi:hypothetical protein AMTRI_Chr05g61860 [Amborella trichopoda]
MDYPCTFLTGVTAAQEDLNSSNDQSFPFRGSLDSDNFKDETLPSFCSERNSLKAPYFWGWEPLMNSCRMSYCRDNNKLESLGKPFESVRRFTESKEISYVNSVTDEKTQNYEKETFVRKADSHVRPASEADRKRAKQSRTKIRSLNLLYRSLRVGREKSKKIKNKRPRK